MSDKTSLSEYADFTDETAVYINAGMGSADAISYTVLGLVGEAGEIANKWKKVLRGDAEHAVQADFASELGDVLWYMARICKEMGISLDDVLAANMAKLRDRKNRAVLKGSGDSR